MSTAIRIAVDHYHDSLRELWLHHWGVTDADKHPPGFNRMPLLGHDGVEEAESQVRAVTVGLNPSFLENTLAQHWGEAPGIPTDVRVPMTAAKSQSEVDAARHMKEMRAAVDLPGMGLEDHWRRFAPSVRALDLYSRHNYGDYYEPVKQLMVDAGYLLPGGATPPPPGCGWIHLDLIPLRVKDQTELECHLKRKRKGGGGILREMVALFAKLLVTINPRVVVVLNAHASRQLEIALHLDTKNGHRYRSPELTETTFFLGSQLSGGATSVYARKRLAADIRDHRLGGTGFRVS